MVGVVRVDWTVGEGAGGTRSQIVPPSLLISITPPCPTDPLQRGDGFGPQGEQYKGWEYVPLHTVTNVDAVKGGAPPEYRCARGSNINESWFHVFHHNVLGGNSHGQESAQRLASIAIERCVAAVGD